MTIKPSDEIRENRTKPVMAVLPQHPHPQRRNPDSVVVYSENSHSQNILKCKS